MRRSSSASAPDWIAARICSFTKQFVDADAAFVAGIIANRAAYGNKHALWFFHARAKQQCGVLGRDIFFPATDAELSHKALRHNRAQEAEIR